MGTWGFASKVFDIEVFQQYSLVTVLRSFSYRLHPTGDQARTLISWLWSLRALYNGALEERRSVYQKQGRSLSLIDQQKSLTVLRAEDEEWKSIPAVVLRSPLRTLDKSFTAFFRRLKAGEKAGFPRYKGRDRLRSFSLQGTTRIVPNGRSSKVLIPKLGLVPFNQYRPLKGTVKDVIFSRSPAGGWKVIFQCDLGPAPEKFTPSSSVGIDLGLSSFITLSTGEEVDNPKYFRQGEQVLARWQQVLSRRKRGSKSRQRARALVAKAHEGIKNQRRDFSRKLVKRLFHNFDVVVHEDLNIRGMKQGLNLGKSISDAAWGVFIHCLQCKAEEAGKLAVAVDPRGTSQRCSGCGETVPKGLSVRVHECLGCGLMLGRDHNAALNILALGQSVVTGVSDNGYTASEVSGVV